MNNFAPPILATLQVIIEKLKNYQSLNYRGLNLSDITFVCVQHLLFTTIDLIKALIILGAKPNNIHIMGKIYSSCPLVIEELTSLGVIYYPSSSPSRYGHFEYYFNGDIINMWSNITTDIITKSITKIIILDDGSKAISNIPQFLSENYKIFAVEQTSSGVAHLKKKNIRFPVINVAYSAAKQLLEAPMIAKAVVNKLDKFLPLFPTTCGVVGLGVIGRAISQKLLSLNHKVIVYDPAKEKYDFMNSVEIVENVQLLFQNSNYIFGCAGEDITVNLDLTQIQGIKNLISCSSQDIEFQTLLKIIHSTSPNYEVEDVLANIDFPIYNGVFKIYRGGYPVNLDNSGESVPAESIQLTRGLLLGGILQAIFQLSQEPVHTFHQYMLHPKLQKLVVQAWVNNQKEYISNRLIKKFLNDEWIKNNSRGEYIDNDIISKYFI